MPSKLAKVLKHVSKKKGPKINSLHENSRDAQRLRRAGARDDRVSRMVAVRQSANRPLLERITFLCDALPETLHPLIIDEIQQLVQRYLARNDEELATVKTERRLGRPPSTRQTLLDQKIKAEHQEYESGLWIADLRDEETLQKLDGWNGNWSSLGQMRFVRVAKSGFVKESQWPPRGAS